MERGVFVKIVLGMVLYCVKSLSRSFWGWTIRSERIRSWLNAAESMAFNFRKTNSFLHVCGLGKSITAYTAWWSVKSEPTSTECSTCSSCRVITKSKILPPLRVGWWTCWNRLCAANKALHWFKSILFVSPQWKLKSPTIIIFPGVRTNVSRNAEKLLKNIAFVSLFLLDGGGLWMTRSRMQVEPDVSLFYWHSDSGSLQYCHTPSSAASAGCVYKFVTI